MRYRPSQRWLWFVLTYTVFILDSQKTFPLKQIAILLNRTLKISLLHLIVFLLAFESNFIFWFNIELHFFKDSPPQVMMCIALLQLAPLNEYQLYLALFSYLQKYVLIVSDTNWRFPSILWTLQSEIVVLLTIRFLEITKFTNLILLSLFSGCRVTFHIVDWKMFSHLTFH